MVKIVSWNINSVRARLGLLDKLIEEDQPDILCLQETKVEDTSFPASWFKDNGYTHHAIKGQKGYHGVATLSRVPIENIQVIDWCEKGDARYIGCSLPDGTHLHNFYVPAGGDEPNPDINDKFAHKLRFLQEMEAWGKSLGGKHVLLGDLNIAPLETDVWSHKQLLKVVSHTPIEVEHLDRVFKSHNWYDAMRHFVPESKKLFSWWSYRSKDWVNADKGRRLDHIWVSKSLKPKLQTMFVKIAARGWERPSDHAPIILELDL